VVAEFHRVLTRELDFRREARHLQMFRQAFAKDPLVKFPEPFPAFSSERVLTMEWVDGIPFGCLEKVKAAGGDFDDLARRGARIFLDMIFRDGFFHADPHPGNILLLGDGHPGLLDWGSVGRIDAGLRGGLQRLLLALDRGDPVMVTDSLLDLVNRPAELDELRLERALGRFLARYFAAGVTPDMRMFTDLFRVVTDFGLSVPAELAAVFRALATIEGTLTQLAPGFDIVDEARRFGGQQLAAQLSPEAIRKAATDELAALLPQLRRIPRRIDRIGGALEDGRLTLNVRLLADPSDRRYLTGLVHQVLLTFLATATGIMAVLMIGLHGGPALTKDVSLYSFFGYCLLVIAAILAIRVLVQVFRPDPGDT
jgi:ubiquinone biosynthesis protein